MKVRFMVIFIGIVFFLAAAYTSLFFFNFKGTPIYGVSFDPEYASYLLPNAGEGFLAVINDWNFKYIRLPAHWDQVEKTRGKYDFSDIDWYVDRAGDNDVKVMLALGQKTPRWPECHIPVWAKDLPHSVYREELKRYISATVEHYKNHPALEFWQVENEPFLGFGSCRPMTVAEAKEEIELVKRLDPRHKTILSDSGELSLWGKSANVADLFGTTVYRKVWNKYVGVWSYKFLPASFYRFKLWLADRAPVEAFIIELQAEPWIAKHINESTPEELLSFVDRAVIQNNISYAQKIGLPRVYLWGAEWWYWLKLKGHNEIPDYIATLNRVP
ncbi:MAG: hypothetical protein A3I29_03025 [Candidatus Magasanikbacteria bacterium RIFCSPLOWO2_02_FULL_44_11]|uniref:GH10 domain-containing protein n=2 Tax=Candidatus Magasanikiibacteriota TaxID=1752731 RepID=A0A1F6N987_9BACT|nr:MAG: hypothetical protein A3I29_03025 [Candidatus Magasanikbacteria bacterium RIFCSPLOWO2_02_FULL_44_11]